MKLILNRTLQSTLGTNGAITHDEKPVCFTIERPWMENRRRVSCIPAGTYTLQKRTSPKFGEHLILLDVPDRDLILIHPANDALKELNGCIAPVSAISGVGKGTESRKACKKLFDLVFPELLKGTIVTLTVK